MVLQLFVLLMFGLEFAHVFGTEQTTMYSGAEQTTNELSGKCMLSKGHQKKQLAAVSKDVAEDSPSCLIGQSVYIRSAESPSKYLSVEDTDRAGDPGILRTCDVKLPGCTWKIVPTTSSNHYYLKTDDTDQTLHWTHGNQGQKARGERATLYPCMSGDYSNCKWRFVKLHGDNDEYLIQSSGEENYLIAPHDDKFSATVDYCDYLNPEPKCVWKLGLSFGSWDFPSCFVGQKAYIQPVGLPSKFLSVQDTDKQGDPGILQTCDSKLPGCTWEIMPAACGSYYLKTPDTDQTLHWTHGNQGQKARGERATLYPCMTGDYSNCKWRFVKLHEDKDEYLIQSSGEENYLIAPHAAKTSATVDHCDYSNPEPKCVWKMKLTFTSWEFPKSLTEHNVYIKWVDMCLSVLQPDVQGDPGILQQCDSSKMWKIVSMPCGQYYLKTPDTDQTLHWTHGNQGQKARGEAATLYPCMTGDYSNCKWRFVKLHEDKDEYLIQSSGEENYLIAPHAGTTLATVDYCDYSSPEPECVWTVSS